MKKNKPVAASPELTDEIISASSYDEPMLIEDAKVMAKGQITIPKKIRDHLHLDIGDRVILVGDGDRVIMIKASAAMKRAL